MFSFILLALTLVSTSLAGTSDDINDTALKNDPDLNFQKPQRGCRGAVVRHSRVKLITGDEVVLGVRKNGEKFVASIDPADETF